MNSKDTTTTSHLGTDRADVRIDPAASPSELEGQLDAKRARIDRTLGQLENKLSPREMMSEGLDLFRDHGGDITQNLGRSFKENPAPFIVAGVGLAWLIASTSASSSQTRRRDFDDTDFDSDRDELYSRSSPRYGLTQSDRYGYESESDDDGESLRERAEGALESISDKASDMSDTLQARYDRLQRKSAQQSDQLRRQARGQMRSARDQGEALTEMLSDRPLITGVCGLAVGALLGALMPPTEMEDRYVGELSDEMKQRAGEQAADGAEQVRRQVESAAESARTTAEEKIDSAKRSSASSESSSTDRTPAATV